MPLTLTDRTLAVDTEMLVAERDTIAGQELPAPFTKASRKRVSTRASQQSWAISTTPLVGRLRATPGGW